jgi:hypothetical protein
MFHVIDKTTGKLAIAQGFWAIGENGRLYDVIDGWGCEGGGGSSIAPGNLVAVFGDPEPEASPEPEKFNCDICDRVFTTKQGRDNHRSMKHFGVAP